MIPAGIRNRANRLTQAGRRATAFLGARLDRLERRWPPIRSLRQGTAELTAKLRAGAAALTAKVDGAPRRLRDGTDRLIRHGMIAGLSCQCHSVVSR